MAARQRFALVLIKPSHYDDDGYVIQWFRSAVPSNSLAVVHGLAVDCRQRRVLGEDVEIVISSMDEDNTRIRPERIARQLAGRRGLVMLVGVQSNQFPRAMDLARPLRAAGVAVCLGGFHISGCLSMLGGPTPEMKEAMDLGVSLFAGEAEEGRMGQVLRDAFAGKLQPLLPRESPLAFYPRYLGEVLGKHLKMAQLAWRFLRFRKRLERDPESRGYTDVALTADREENVEQLEVLHAHEPAAVAAPR